MRKSILFSLLMLIVLSPGFARDIRGVLADIPGLRFKTLEARRGFSQSFELFLSQPLDHRNPAAGTFEQRLYLDHLDPLKPLILITEGYAIETSHRNELSELLAANQLQVEHRFFGESLPDSINWQYLTVRQSAEDLHRIAVLFRRIYTGKWISTGISKGGQTALFFRRYYPQDVDITVPVVAPLPLAVEDPRLDRHLATVGSAECRMKIAACQRLLLQHREQLLPLLNTWAQDKEQQFSIGDSVAFEYAVLEYPFSFWQWGATSCADIPGPDTPPGALFAHLEKINAFDLYTDSGILKYEPFFYQAMTELGYYGFPHDHLRDLLRAVPRPHNRLFAPQGVDLIYRPEVMRDIHHWLVSKGERILYIYGELDTWSGAAVIPEDSLDALRMVNPGGNHTTRIHSFPVEMRQQIYRRLSGWLGMEVQESRFGKNFLLFNGLFMLLILAGTLFLAWRKSRINSLLQRHPSDLQ